MVFMQVLGFLGVTFTLGGWWVVGGVKEGISRKQQHGGTAASAAAPRLALSVAATGLL